MYELLAVCPAVTLVGSGNMNKAVRRDLTEVAHDFASPSAYDVRAEGGVPEAAVAQYERDGVVCLRHVLGPEAVAQLREDMDEAVAHPAPAPMHMKQGGTPQDPSFFYFEYQMHERFDSFRRLVWEGEIPGYAMTLMRSPMLGLFYMNSFVKEGGALDKPTPWHQDGSYSRMLGEKVINFYIALDRMPAESTLRFKQGSHRAGITYLPSGGDWEGPSTQPVTRGKVTMPPFPEIDAGFPTVGWALEPGDALVFQQRTLHAAPGNPFSYRRHAVALVLCGDDVRYDASPGTNDPPFEDPDLKDGDVPWGAVFPRVR